MKRKTFSLDGSGKNLATAKCNFWFPLHEMIERNKSNEMLNQNFLFWIWQHDPTAKHRLKKVSSTAPSCGKWGQKERLIIWDHAGLQHQKWSSCSCLQCSFPSFPDAAISWFFFTSNCWSLSRLVKLWRRIKREATNGTGTRLKQQSQFSMCKFTTRKADVEQCAQSRCNPPPASTKMQPARHSLRDRAKVQRLLHTGSGRRTRKVNMLPCLRDKKGHHADVRCCSLLAAHLLAANHWRRGSKFQGNKHQSRMFNWRAEIT